jgi:hypothetical protein
MCLMWDLIDRRMAHGNNFYMKRAVRGDQHAPSHAGSPLADFYTLKMEAIRSSETSVNSSST